MNAWKTLGFLFVMSLLAGCGQSDGVKTVNELTQSEKGALDYLVTEIYKEVSPKNGGLCPLIYNTQYSAVPLENGSYGERLSQPLTLLSGACVGSYMLLPTTLAAIKEGMANKSATWDEQGKKRRLSILEGYLVPSYGGAGGSFGISNDMVTIIPTKIRIE